MTSVLDGHEEGRAGKRRSHRYYLVPVESIPDWARARRSKARPQRPRRPGHPGPFTKSFRHRGTKAESSRIVGTGGQCVCPPSIWASEDGTRTEPREWEGGEPGDPAVVPFLDLWRGVRRTGLRVRRQDSRRGLPGLRPDALARRRRRSSSGRGSTSTDPSTARCPVAAVMTRRSPPHARWCGDSTLDRTSRSSSSAKPSTHAANRPGRKPNSATNAKTPNGCRATSPGAGCATARTASRRTPRRRALAHPASRPRMPNADRRTKPAPRSSSTTSASIPAGLPRSGVDSL